MPNWRTRRRRIGVACSAVSKVGNTDRLALPSKKLYSFTLITPVGRKLRRRAREGNPSAGLTTTTVARVARKVIRVFFFSFALTTSHLFDGARARSVRRRVARDSTLLESLIKRERYRIRLDKVTGTHRRYQNSCLVFIRRTSTGLLLNTGGRAKL